MEITSQVGDQKYLNVNLGHELWKDISFSALQINCDDPPVTVYICRLLLRWIGFNTLVFIMLYRVTTVVFGHAPVF